LGVKFSFHGDSSPLVIVDLGKAKWSFRIKINSKITILLFKNHKYGRVFLSFSFSRNGVIASVPFKLKILKLSFRGYLDFFVVFFFCYIQCEWRLI
jgi:hypothetical protein